MLVRSLPEDKEDRVALKQVQQHRGFWPLIVVPVTDGAQRHCAQRRTHISK